MTPIPTLADRLRQAPEPRAKPQGRVSAALATMAERAVRERLAKLQHGCITLVDHGQAVRYGTPDARCPLAVTLQVRDPRFYAEIAFGGSVGAGESYMAGDWQADDLTGVVRILLNNRDLLDGMEGGLARLAAPLRKAAHAFARNTREGSRRNIGAHYDIGNDFFMLFLDPTLMYSSAVFDRPGMTLEEASIAKLDLICRKLALKPGDHVLEIGTGWGGFALHAARHYGCHVTTTTISQQQHDLARERFAAAGLQDRITLRLDDYRDLQGQYDKLVSIEMIEAIGHQYFDTFFRRCAELLKPEGTMLLQSITIADQQYEAARDSVDFIKKHIFPGCCIPAVTALAGSIARASDMRIVDLQDIGPHYATTLAAWRTNMFRNLERVRALGYPDTFIRMWEFYLCYCEGGFTERALGDVQMVLTRPQARWAGPALSEMSR